MTVEQLFEHEAVLHGLPDTRLVEGAVLDSGLTIVVYDSSSDTGLVSQIMHVRRWTVMGENGTKGGGISKTWFTKKEET
jgi:hypothetical protein